MPDGNPYQFLPDLSDEDYKALKADIADRGILVAVEYDQDGNVLDGHHRIRACLELGVSEWPRIVRSFETEADKRTHARQLNIARRHLNQEQRRQLIEDELRDRPERSNRQIANGLGVDHKTVGASRERLESGGEIPHLDWSEGADGKSYPARPKVAAVDLGSDAQRATLNAAKDIRMGMRAATEAERVPLKPATIPGSDFDVLIVDPPWPQKKIARDVRPNQVVFDYPVKTHEEIMQFGSTVNEMAAVDAHLFLWTTHKELPFSFELLKVWEWRYVCTLVWHKAGGFQPHGLPQYNCEFALYARRGSPTFASTKTLKTCFEGKRREHSRKPDEFYEMIERCTSGRRVDVYSREKRDGFEQYGNEISKFSEGGS